jgi:signal transduction histidine kinase
VIWSEAISLSGGVIESSSQASSEAISHDPEGRDKPYHDLLALSRVSAAVSGLWDLDAILEVALDNVLNIMDDSIGGILLLDEDTKTLSYRVHRGLSPKYAEEVRLKLGEGIAGTVAQTSKAILLEDVSTEPLVAYHDLVQAENLRALISVPLRSKETVWGVINVASHSPHRFTRDDLHLLHSIGDQVGVAIEQARLYERLAKGRDRYRQLARQVLIAQEEARRRLSRELHDETSQTLSGLALNLQALVDMAEMAGVKDQEFKARLRKAHSLAVQIGTEVSRIIRELRPTLLDTLGLVPAIRQYAETTLGHLGINVSLEAKGNFKSLPPEEEAGLFRFAQGAIGNIARHSEAKNVTISMECKANDLLLRIADDGKGFDVAKITGIEETGRGRGLFSMKERVSLLGGACLVKSQPGEGTIVTARVPVIRSMADAEDKSTGGR